VKAPGGSHKNKAKTAKKGEKSYNTLIL